MRLILRFASKPPAARIAAIASDVGARRARDDLTLLAVYGRAASDLMNATHGRSASAAGAQ